MAHPPTPSPDTTAERLAIDQGRASLALSAAAMGEFEWDQASDTFIVSPRMAEIGGLPAGEQAADRGEFILRHVHPDDRDYLSTAIREGLAHQGRYEVTHRFIRPTDGRTIWIYSAAQVAPGSGAAPDQQRIIGVVQDISARKSVEDEREALVAELDHRVKNVLASVQSLASQSARKTASLDTFLKTFAGRLEAMASAHTLLTATRWRGAEIGNIATAELGGLAPGQARWEGPEIVLNPRATNALTLALHELATNALKYGALSGDMGRVEVHWRALPDGGFELTWLERDGPSVSLPTHRGFGSTLLERVTGRELGGKATVEFRPDGVRAILTADRTALAGARGRADPAAQAAPASAPQAATAIPVEGASAGIIQADDVRGVRVFIVEDSLLLALELESGLTEAGAKVVAMAADVEEALKQVGEPMDVAVLDANLNGDSVTPVAAALAAKGVPFIFATGYGDVGPAPEGFDAPVVRKPYNVHQISAAIVEALAR